MMKKHHVGAHAIFLDWLKKERKSIFEVFGKSKSDYVRGLRRELSAVEIAYKRACRGEL